LNCTACAVGNLVAANLGYKYVKTKTHTTGQCELRHTWEHKENKAPGSIFRFTSRWSDVFGTPYGVQYFHLNNYSGEAKREIDSTGYSVSDLAKIEFAFESAPKGCNQEEWMFNGLMAVVEVLGQIHEADQETIQASKDLFVRA
jgi:hypothetical protein